MLNILVNFEVTKKADNMFKSLKDVQSLFCTYFDIYQLSKFEEIFQVVSSFPFLLRHPVSNVVHDEMNGLGLGRFRLFI